MMQILDRDVLETLLTPADLAGVRRTIEDGGWGGMPVPGEERWDLTPREGMPCERLISLGLHCFTQTYPGAESTLYAIPAQILHYAATGWSSGYPVEDDPRYERAQAWLLAFAGGQPAPPGEMLAISPPMERETGRCLVPGDRAEFTRAALKMIEALLFVDEATARRVITEYLAQVGAVGERAAAIFARVSRWQYQGLGPVRCFDCAAADLDHWYTSKQGGYHLCPSCFAARQARGRAKEAD